MITFLDGEIVEKHPTRIVMGIGGIGYEVFVPLSSYDRLPPAGDKCRILIYDYIKEDAHKLFGFVSEAERDVFVLLMSVGGIGPKLALSVLSGLTVMEIRAAVVEGDVKRLSSISGIGRKMAERMVVELRDRIGDAEALEAVSFSGGVGDREGMRDAVMALTALGYQESIAGKMVMAVLQKTAGSDLSVEDIVKRALGG